MFKKYQKATATVTTLDRAVVRDRYTKRVIMQGTLADCQAYVSAFGLCFVEAI